MVSLLASKLESVNNDNDEIKLQTMHETKRFFKKNYNDSKYKSKTENSILLDKLIERRMNNFEKGNSKFEINFYEFVTQINWESEKETNLQLARINL
eukprot:CAMPEP_0116900504 /NCGR_PEP_ID=MMETSP0467-20121206/8757_1 /TAXON_ID=283647 /ORGANISM="Mesodinium pulex, Strain SPMC105" /LENGTH=96 /DNA_ID=CAMNT_0004573759 /DNA_START=953 /DNA_END=1243 /DNA_ORIENTATION=+